MQASWIREQTKVDNTLIMLHSPDGNPVLKVQSPGDEGVACVSSPGYADVKLGAHLEAFVHLLIQRYC